jgi:hypothetical protein
MRHTKAPPWSALLMSWEDSGCVFIPGGFDDGIGATE